MTPTAAPSTVPFASLDAPQGARSPGLRPMWLDVVHLGAAGLFIGCVLAAVAGWVAHSAGAVPRWAAAMAVVAVPMGCAVQGGVAAHSFYTLGPDARSGGALASFWRGAIVASGGLLTAPAWFLHQRWRRPIARPTEVSVALPSPVPAAPFPTELTPVESVGAEVVPQEEVTPPPRACVFGHTLEDEATVIAPPRPPGSARPGRSRGRQPVEVVSGPFRVVRSGQLAPTVQVRRRGPASRRDTR